MVYEMIKCPYCKSEKIVKYGKSKSGKQKYKCCNEECSHTIFQREYVYNACVPGVREKIIDMVMNGSGTRDTGRVLGVDKDTVTAVLKKYKNFPKQVNEDYLTTQSKNIEIDIVCCTEAESEELAKKAEIGAEMDEMWSYYQKKKNQLWLWWAVDHENGVPLAYTFGTREHKYLDELLRLLKPFNIVKVFTDANYAYESKIKSEKLVIGKKNTQKIERHHLTLRTRIKRLARKTICFSKSKMMHEIVIGIFINIYFFGRNFPSSTS